MAEFKLELEKLFLKYNLIGDVEIKIRINPNKPNLKFVIKLTYEATQ